MDINWVEKIENSISNALIGYENQVAVIAMGSVARGEETYFLNVRGERELLSDFEMLIIVDKIKTRDEIDELLCKIRDQYKRELSSPCFDLEWSYKTRHQLSYLDKRFIFFEAKESGKLIFGKKEYINLLPEINLANLNYCELNSVVIHRLYHVLRDINVEDAHYKKYLIARNTLDVSTAILPLCGRLISSYKRRNEEMYILKDNAGISDALLQRMENYLDMKLDYSSELYDTVSFGDMCHDFAEDMKYLYNTQKELQKGQAFRPNSRLVISSFYRLNFRSLWKAIHWCSELDALYHQMITLMTQETISQGAIERIKDKMSELFSYE